MFGRWNEFARLWLFIPLLAVTLIIFAIIKETILMLPSFINLE